MGTSIAGRLVGWLKGLEARGDAWAAKRLTAEEYADAVVLDRRLKENFWRWLGYYAAVATLVSVAFAMLAPKLGWLRSVLVANVMCLGVLMSLASAWYGYRKFTGSRALRTMAIFFAMMLVGAFVGMYVASVDGGPPLAAVSAEKLVRVFATALLVGIVLMGLLLAVAQMRSREVRQRMALLEAEAAREKLARQSLQAELRMLQAQVEPHFLFNTLANLRELVKAGSPDALRMLDHLTHYLRTALPEMRAEGSTLGREVELARAYLEVMALRMGGALRFELRVADGLQAVPFPPLMLVTLVENAIKHGVAPLGRGRVAVSAAVAGERLRVEVVDDGRGIGEPSGGGVGLANIRERLRGLYGEAGRLDLRSAAPAGTCATIEVPLDTAA